MSACSSSAAWSRSIPPCTESRSSGSSATSALGRSSPPRGNERFRALLGKVERLGDTGRLGAKPVREAAVEFNAMMEGLGNAELRGGVFRNLPEGDEERAWRNALGSLVNGFARGYKLGVVLGVSELRPGAEEQPLVPPPAAAPIRCR